MWQRIFNACVSLLLLAAGCQYDRATDERTSTNAAEPTATQSFAPTLTNIHSPSFPAEADASSSAAVGFQPLAPELRPPRPLPTVDASTRALTNDASPVPAVQAPASVTLAVLNSPAERANQQTLDQTSNGFMDVLNDVRIFPIDTFEAIDNQRETSESKRQSAQSSDGQHFAQRLKIPAGLPGAEAPQIQLPPVDTKNSAERQQAIDKLFPPLPSMGEEFCATVGPQAKPLSLKDLEEMARLNSPTIRQAMADVRAANGTAMQAGLYPNPTLGYESDNINTGRTAGYQGGFVDQVIKTGGKLQLTRASAMVDVDNAQVWRYNERDTI